MHHSIDVLDSMQNLFHGMKSAYEVKLTSSKLSNKLNSSCKNTQLQLSCIKPWTFFNA